MIGHPYVSNSSPEGSPQLDFGRRLLVIYVGAEIASTIAALSELLRHLINQVLNSLAQHLLDTELLLGPTGSGDTLRMYLGQATQLVLVLATATVWQVAQPMRAPDPRLVHSAKVGLRLTLALNLLVYGVAKLSCTQMSAPLEERLLAPLGDTSPMGLIWTMVGMSVPYQVVCGALEFVAGLLLLWRRTTFAGALLGLGVMSNVWLLNMCFDIPVKLFSFTLLLYCVFFCLENPRRLWAILDATQVSVVVPTATVWHTRRAQIRAAWGYRVVCSVMVAFSLVGWIASASFQHSYPHVQEQWLIDELERNGVPMPDDAARPERWLRMSTSRFPDLIRMRPYHVMGSAGIRFELRRLSAPTTETDPAASAANTALIPLEWENDFVADLLEINYGPRSPQPDESPCKPLKVITSKSDELVFRGEARFRDSCESWAFRLRRLPFDRKKTMLIGRGFHWINEFPVND